MTGDLTGAVTGAVTGDATGDATRTLFVDGIALWTPALPGWAAARDALRAAATAAERVPANGAAAPRNARPQPTLLGANERRRAGDAVALALQVAGDAVAASGHPAATLASVFTSAHGDPQITDALCRALACDPLLLSPTRFHNSVHNAASGYWAIASASVAASTALAAGARSFAAGLLEAACQCAADDAPVLLVGCDTAACGALVSVNASRGQLALALVLAPRRGATSCFALQWAVHHAPARATALRSAAARALADNAMADALPLFEALARAEPFALPLPLTDAVQLQLSLAPLGATTLRA